MAMLDFICMVSAEMFWTGGIENFKMKIYVFSGIQTNTRLSTRGKSALYDYYS